MDCKDKLLAARTYAEAKRIMETMNVGPSARKLAEIAFANPSSREVLLSSIIQEQEGAADREDEKTEGAKDIDKKMKEEQLKTERQSEGSSDSTLPLKGEGTDGEVTDLKGASGEDQMKEGFGGPPGGGQPPMGGGGMCPEVAQQMAPQMPQMPQMNTPQMMKQMHYTVTEAIKPMVKKINRLEEAIIAVDKKVQETSSFTRSISLDIPKGSPNTAMPQMREMDSMNVGEAIDAARTKRTEIDLNNKRAKIAEIDSIVSQTPYR